MKHTDMKNYRTLTVKIVNKTLTEKVKSLESTLYELNRNMIHDDETAGSLIDKAQYTLFEIKCIAAMIDDPDMNIFSCANAILADMQKAAYYDRKEMILAAESEKGYFIGAVNAAMHVLESTGIVGRRTIDKTETVYLVDSSHRWIVDDPEQSGTR